MEMALDEAGMRRRAPGVSANPVGSSCASTTPGRYSMT